MSTGETSCHNFGPNPTRQSVCKRCGATGWSMGTTCPAGLPRCESCRKPKAQSPADADSGLFCCKGFGASQSCAMYVPAYVNLQSEIYADSDVIVTHMHTDYTGSGIQVEEVPMTFERLYPGQYAEPSPAQRDIDAELGALVRKSLDTLAAPELYRLQRKLGEENPRLAPVITNIFAAYRAAKEKMET